MVLKISFLGQFFSLKIYIVKAMSRFFGPKIAHHIVIFYRLTFVAIIHNLIKNTFYLSLMAVLDKDDFRPKRMTTYIRLFDLNEDFFEILSEKRSDI